MVDTEFNGFPRVGQHTARVTSIRTNDLFVSQESHASGAASVKRDVICLRSSKKRRALLVHGESGDLFQAGGRLKDFIHFDEHLF